MVGVWKNMGLIKTKEDWDKIKKDIKRLEQECNHKKEIKDSEGKYFLCDKEWTEEEDWENKYPLNTFKGETKRELVKFIYNLVKQIEERKDKEYLDFSEKMNKTLNTYVEKERQEIGRHLRKWFKGKNKECIEDAIERITRIKI